MTSTPEIRPLAIGDADEASQLVIRSFERFIAPDWTSEAHAGFIAECDADHLREAIRTATCALGAFVGGEMAGVSLMPRPSLLKVFFVHPAFVRSGVGRALWEATRRQLEADGPQAPTVELNASPYAVAFYRSVGFVPISREYVHQGCRVTRMACWLPARALGVEI